MALTFLGTTSFSQSGPEQWKQTQFELDQLSVPYSGAVTGVTTYLAGLTRGSAYGTDANMFLTDWSVDSNKQFPTVTLEYTGAKGGTLPAVRNEQGRSIQSATSYTSSAIFPLVASQPASVQYYAPSNTATAFAVDPALGTEPDDPADITVDDLISWTLVAEQPANSMPEIAEWILENGFVQRITETTDAREIVNGQYWQIVKRKTKVLMPYAPS